MWVAMENPSSQGCFTCRLLSLALDKVQRVLLGFLANAAHIIAKANSETFICNSQHFRSERCANELPSRWSVTPINGVFVCPIREVQQVICNRCSVLRVQVCVDLVKNVERCWISCLDSKDECEAAKT